MDRKMTAGRFMPIVALVMILAMVAVGQPVSNGIELKNIAYKREGVVANVQGYLSINDSRMKLDFANVTQARRSEDPDHRYVRLSGEEFVFELEYVRQDGGKPSEHYQFSDLTMLVRDKRPGHAYSTICFFDEQFALALPAKSRYSCNREQSHQCSLNGKPVANLVLTAFELEVDGVPSKAAKLQFSKNPWAESCEQWDK